MAAVSFLGIVLVSGSAMLGLNQLGASIVNLVESDFPLAENIADIEILQLRQSVALERTVLDAVRFGTKDFEYLQGVEHFRSIDQKISLEFSHIIALLNEKAKNSAQAELEIIHQLLEEVQSAHSNYSAQATVLFDDLGRSSDVRVESLDQQMRSLLDKEEHLAEQLASINAHLVQYVAERGVDLEHLEASWLQKIAIAGLLISIFCAVIFILIYRSVKAQLGVDPEELVLEVKKIAEGNLIASGINDAGLHTGVYASVCAMRERLAEIIGEAAQISLMVRQGAGELSAGNMGLSERTEHQAASLEETASSAEQIAMTVHRNAGSAKSACALASSTAKQAEGGGETAKAAVNAMEVISASSEKINAITSVIDEIAFQTNLLALNAAVEAARAGEQGRGFAVVANEVRQLAGRSASAAKEIKELIDTSVKQVQGGTDLVRETGEELQKIVGSVTELTKIVTQITDASEQQSMDVDQINQALTQLDTSTQQNTALVEEAAATSESLSQLASQLNQKVGYFSVA